MFLIIDAGFSVPSTSNYYFRPSTSPPAGSQCNGAISVTGDGVTGFYVGGLIYKSDTKCYAGIVHIVANTAAGNPDWMLAQDLPNHQIPMKINSMFHQWPSGSPVPYLFGCGRKYDQANISPFQKFSFFFRIKDPLGTQSEILNHYIMNLDGTILPLKAFDDCIAIEPSLNNPNKAYSFVLNNEPTVVLFYLVILDYSTMKASTFDFHKYYNFANNVVTFAMFYWEYNILFMGTLKRHVFMSVPYAASKAFINLQRTDSIDYTGQPRQVYAYSVVPNSALVNMIVDTDSFNKYPGQNTIMNQATQMPFASTTVTISDIINGPLVKRKQSMAPSPWYSSPLPSFDIGTQQSLITNLPPMSVNGAIDYVEYSFSVSPAIPTETSLVVVQPAAGVSTNVALQLKYDWTLDATQIQYIITIHATLVDGDETHYRGIVLPVTNSCSSAILASPITGFQAPLDLSPHTLAYVVGSPSINYSPFPIGNVNPGTCLIRTEIRGGLIGNPVITLTKTSTPISYDAYSRILTIYTISDADVGTYEFQYWGFVNGNPSQNQVTTPPYYLQFFVQISSQCTNSIISIVAVPPITHSLQSLASTKNNLVWTQSLPSCAPITYTITQLAGVSLNTAAYSIVVTGGTLTQLVITTQPPPAGAAILPGNYIFRLDGNVGAFVTTVGQPQVASQIITLTITDSCLSKIQIIPSQILDQIVVVNGEILQVQIGGFKSTQSEAFCGKFTYELVVKDKNGQVNQQTSIFFYNNATSLLVLVSTDKKDTVLSPYQVRVKGYQGNFIAAAAETFFNVYVRSTCKVTSVKPIKPTLSFTYMVSETIKVIELPSMNIFPQGCSNLIAFQIIPIQSSIAINARVIGESPCFKIWTEDEDQSGTYQYKLIQTVKNEDFTQVHGIQKIQLEIKSKNSGAPRFKDGLEDVVVCADSKLEYSLPLIVDPDQDDYPEISYINYNGADQFINKTSEQKNMVFEPKEEHAGKVYKIQVTLRDQNKWKERTSEESFNVVVLTQNQCMDLNKTERVPKVFNLNNPMWKSKLLKADIKSVSQTGIATISFNRAVMLPNNYNLFDNKTIDIEVKTQSSEGFTIVKRNITSWNVTGFTKSSMTIQIIFEDPKSISQNVEYDRLTIRFLEDYLIIAEDLQSSIDQRVPLIASVPPQIDSSKLSKILIMGSDAFSISLVAAVSANLVLGIFAGLSMKRLWMMISAMQIISHYPMLRVPLPANFLYFLRTIIEISNLGLLPKKYVMDFMQKTFSSGSKTFDSNLAFMGYDSTDPLENAGLVFLALLFLCILGLFVYGIKRILDKFEILQKIVDLISKKLFFNSYFRPHLKGYIKLNLSALISINTFSTLSRFKQAISVIMLIYLFVVPFFFYYLLVKYDYDDLTSETISNRMNALYLNLKPNSKLALLYTPFFLIRRLALAITITFNSFSSLLQCHLIIAQSFFTLLFLLVASPFDSINGTIFEFLNEFTVLLVSTGVYACVDTDSMSNEVRYELGWVLIALCLLNFFANLINMIVKIYQGIRKAVRKKCLDMKMKKEQQEEQMNKEEEEQKQLDSVLNNQKEGEKNNEENRQKDLKIMKECEFEEEELKYQGDLDSLNKQGRNDDFEIKSNIRDGVDSNQQRSNVNGIKLHKRQSILNAQDLQVQSDPKEESKKKEGEDQFQDSFAQDTLEETKVNMATPYLYHYTHHNMDPSELKQLDVSKMTVAELIVYKQMQQQNQKRKKKRKVGRNRDNNLWDMKGI